MIKGDRVPIRVWANVQELESDALRQLKAVAALPWVAHHVAVMPDVHVGKGATVGSVIALRGAVAPAAVGVDIGCGMAAQKTNLTAKDLPDSLRKLRLAIEAAIPVGRAQYKAPVWAAEPTLKHAGELLMDRFSELDSSVQGLAARAATPGNVGRRQSFHRAVSRHRAVCLADAPFG